MKKLCYIENQTAYFTDKHLSKQWGDDWNDAPYEHNAEVPYDAEDMVVLKFEAELQTPADRFQPNSQYSVEMINKQEVEWLKSPTWEDKTVKIWAGVSPEEFKVLVKEAGGSIWVKDM